MALSISNLTLIVTDDCNFDCSYCFQKKEPKTMDHRTIRAAVDFFYPCLKSEDRVDIGFYGGEPLLAYEQIKHAVRLVRDKNKTDDKKITFSLTTNGALLTEEKLDFFKNHGFALMLSFDGRAQEMGRKPGTLEAAVRLLEQIAAYPDLDFEINSVFTPRTVGMFSESLRFIIEQGRAEATFNLSIMEPWRPAHLHTLERELRLLTDFLICRCRETGKIPVKNFQEPQDGPEPGIFRCSAGQDRMAVAPGGRVWGCYLFHDYFKNRRGQFPSRYRDFCFGTLEDFTARGKAGYPEIAAHYADLRQDLFRVEGDFCFLCRDIKRCVVCPVHAAYTSGALGRVSRRQCRLIRMELEARRNFRSRLLKSPP